jgi:hypothetical protein
MRWPNDYYPEREVWLMPKLGIDEPTRILNPRRPMDIVTILIIVILVLLAIYLFQRVF